GIIGENLRALGFLSRARVHRVTTERAAGRLAASNEAPYTLVLADPPYYDEGAVQVVEAVAASPLVAEHTIIVLEHHRSTTVLESLGTLPLYKSRRHGDTVVSIYAQQESS